SSSGLNVGGVSVPPGGAARLSYSGGQYVVTTSPTCGGPESAPVAVSDPTVYPTNPYPGNDVNQMVTLCTTGTSYRAQLHLIARTEFSSSTGGWSAGGTFPAVRDDGDSVSPYHDWTVTVPAASVAAAYGVGTLTEMTVLTRNGLGADGGRVLSIRIAGTAATV